MSKKSESTRENKITTQTSIRDGFGLALSGGGSRAAAFHRGTLQALMDLDLVDKIRVISTVSGGSLFGGAWMAARADGISDEQFLSILREELNRGFIKRSLGLKMVKLALPNYSRTNLIAETFNRIFFKGKTLANLPGPPHSPELCINTTILNNGQVGKFSKDGFSAWGIYNPEASPKHVVPFRDFPLALAVAASAAFPIGLPPIYIRRSDFPAQVEFRNTLFGVKTIALTDGGVLENLGIQTLLKSQRYGTWHLAVSDAGTKDDTWHVRPARNSIRSFGVWLGSGRILDRIMLIMNSKQNRWARQQVIEEIHSSWLADALEHPGKIKNEVTSLLLKWKQLGRREGFFVRVDQSWTRMLSNLAPYTLRERGASEEDIKEVSKDITTIESLLEQCGVDLAQARAYYEKLGGDSGAEEVNRVSTNFTGLPTYLVDKLAYHAAWQVHATYAIYCAK